MCGIFGIVGHGTFAPEALHRCFRHRGPDSEGLWEAPGVVLGHNRLAILDLSSNGAQPMRSSSGRYVVTYNGEIYNFAEIREELLKLHGCAFRGTSDTEVLLAAIEQWELDGALQRIDGIFAFGVWDSRENELLLARDRFGVKPLAFGYANGIFWFASDTRFVRALAETPVSRLSPEGLELFLRYGYVPAPYSIYPDTWKLEAGCVARFTKSSCTRRRTYDELRDEGAIRRYWRPDPAGVPLRIDAGEATDELARLLSGAVRSQMVSDVPLGAFLSGGIDSSTIVALMARHATGPVRTFAVGFDDPKYDESGFARGVARHLGVDHHEICCTAERARELIPQLGAVYDEPFGDSSQLPMLLVSRLAREHVTVALSGDGGDELFGGYQRYRWFRSFDRLRSLLPRAARHLAARSIRAVGAKRWQRLSEWNTWLVPRAVPADAAGTSAMTVATLLELRERGKLYELLMNQWPRMLPESALPRDPLSSRRSAVFEGGGSLHARMTRWDMEVYLSDDILTKVDRASMWWGLEARVPFLDRKVVEFVLALPDAVRFAPGSSKSLLRNVLFEMVPRELVDREKQGFNVPIDRWLKGPLREWAESLVPIAGSLLGEQLEGIDIGAQWRAFAQGSGRWNPGLWSALMLASWWENARSQRE